MNKRSTAVAGVFLSALVLALGLGGCQRATSVWQNRGGPPRVVVTIPALDNFVRNVGGEHVAILCLCTRQGPHQYQQSFDDAIALRDADLFFAIGLTLDDKFADNSQLDSHNPRLRYIKLGERLPKKLLQANAEHEEGKNEHEEGHNHPHDHGEYDPHVWLGIPQAIAMVELIRDELKKVDGEHAGDFDKNAEAYIKKLEKLHADGKDKLKDKKNRKLIAFHESLGYFAKSFDLNIVDVLELSPGSEPSSPHLAKVAQKCKEKDVHVIAVEPQYPQVSSAGALKEQIKDIKFVVVDPLETVDDKDLTEDHKELSKKNVDWYERKMRQNLDALAKDLP
jgi:ABC-type Zn uptake system ZnuABC Zn-binding protein ZnuA